MHMIPGWGDTGGSQNGDWETGLELETAGSQQRDLDSLS
jgi:hypothetical protein